MANNHHLMLLMRSTEPQLKTLLNHIKFKTPTDTGNFYSSNNQKWLLYKILSAKIVNTVQIDPQTTEVMLLSSLKENSIYKECAVQNLALDLTPIPRDNSNPLSVFLTTQNLMKNCV